MDHITLEPSESCGPYLRQVHEGARFQLDPFLTPFFGGSILKWVTLEFRLIMHEKIRVTQKF